MEAMMKALKQGGEMYAIEPKRDCPHVPLVIEHFPEFFNETVDISKEVFNSACANCKNTEENWMCLSCGELNCSRYVEGHAEEHSNTLPEHPISISLSDLSVWCYQCDAYIESQWTTRIVCKMAEIKDQTTTGTRRKRTKREAEEESKAQASRTRGKKKATGTKDSKKARKQGQGQKDEAIAAGDPTTN